jgi:hypothetical protein
VAQNFMEALRSLIRHCTSPSAVHCKVMDHEQQTSWPPWAQLLLRRSPGI